MTSHHYRGPRTRGDLPCPIDSHAEHYLGVDDLDVEIDFDAIQREAATEISAEWLDRYGEENWYAAITLFGLFSVGDDTPLEEIPEEYRWKGMSRRYPSANGRTADEEAS